MSFTALIFVGWQRAAFVGSENSDPFAVYPTTVQDQSGSKLKSLVNLTMPGRFAGSLFVYSNAAAGLRRRRQRMMGPR